MHVHMTVCKHVDLLNVCDKSVIMKCVNVDTMKGMCECRSVCIHNESKCIHNESKCIHNEMGTNEMCVCVSILS